MPELPEVETVRRTLLPVRGARIVAVNASKLKLRMLPIPRRDLQRTIGSAIVELRRFGKYLLLDTSGDHSIMVHLGMSGRFRIHDRSEAVAKHTHVTFTLEDQRKRAFELRFCDPRRFGQVEVVPRATARGHGAIGLLGPDPISEPELFTSDYLFAKSRGKSTTVKAFILDQRVIAGVGNIYASEALWQIGVRPTKPAGTLTRSQADALTTAITRVFMHALDHGGTSLKDFVDGDGTSGEHADYLAVYGREGQPCQRCPKKIVRLVLQGRATYFCQTCQKA